MKKTNTIYNTHVFSIVALLLMLFYGSTIFAINKDGRKIDSLLMLSKYDQSRMSAKDYFDLTYYEFHRDSLFRAAEYASVGISRATVENDYEVLGNLYNIKGYIYLSYGTLVKSIDFFSKGEQIGHEYNIPKVIIGAEHGMGRVYNELGEYDKALEVLYSGLKMALADSSFGNAGAFYNAIGVSLQSMGDINGALENLNHYLELSQQKGDSLSMLYAYVNIGEAYRLDSNYDVALEYYYKAQSLNNRINDAQVRAAVYGNIANIYSARGEYKESIAYLKKVINVCSNNNGLSSYLLTDYKSIIDDYAMIFSYDSAYVYYKKYIAFRDSVNELDRMRVINNLRAEYAIEEGEAQAKILEQKLYNRTLVLIFSVSLSLLIILLLILTYSRYKLRTRVLKDEAKALNLTIDEKNRELVTRVMNQNRQEEVYEDITKTLVKLEKSNDPSEYRSELEAIKKKLMQNDRMGMDWDSFKMHFENVHPDFFGKLLKKNNTLTQNDLRLCGYIKLNLSTKDIANILNVSDRTIQTSRYRIKKKLNLPQDVNLIQYIQVL